MAEEASQRTHADGQTQVPRNVRLPWPDTLDVSTCRHPQGAKVHLPRVQQEDVQMKNEELKSHDLVDIQDYRGEVYLKSIDK